MERREGGKEANTEGGEVAGNLTSLTQRKGK